MSSTKTIRANLAILLRAAVLPGGSIKCFKTVYPEPPTSLRNEDMPACIISMPPDGEREERISEPAGAGWKKITYTIQLDILNVYEPQDQDAATDHMDDMLDGVSDKLHDPASIKDSGALALMYETVTTERRKVEPPAQEPGFLLLAAVRRFSAMDFVVG